jgi:hypothetical protein
VNENVENLFIHFYSFNFEDFDNLLLYVSTN